MKLHLRVCIGVALALCLLAAPLAVLAAGTPSLSPDAFSKTGSPGTTVTYTVTIRNNGPTEDQFRIEYPATTSSPNNTANWPVRGSVPSGNTVFLNNDSATTFQIFIDIPANANTTPGSNRGALNITATSVSEPTRSNAITLFTEAVAEPTTSPTATTTGTPEPSPTRTGTPEPTPVCGDEFEPNNDRREARIINVDVAQDHVMCPAADEDWLFFAGLSGKVYTIDVPEAADGIDLSLSLYDENGNLLAFNDDYYERGGSPDPMDIKPRIDSWRAPANGHYYIKVRDAAGSGRVGGTYSVVVNAESYGPTPTLVAEICLDLYEPDGLPEQAPLMTVGERQPDHRLCPTGDADWIRFFGSTGKTYTIATNNLTVGADTVMVLADRDGVSIIDFNDDYNNTLASRIVFTPRVDGFYYVQIKNIGDIGNQFIGFDLALDVSVGGVPAEPTRDRTAPTRTPQATPTETPEETPEGTPEETPDEGTPSPTPTGGPTGTPSPTPTEEAYTMSHLSDKVPVANAPGGRFIDPAFASIWRRSDGPIADQATQRSWLWGPEALVARAEVYDQAAGGLRQVQYFDKARMEITDHAADRSSQWYVTNGLLVRELIEGRVQIGHDSYVNFSPAEIVIAGDLDDPNAPTYHSLKSRLEPAGDRTGSTVDETISRDGSIGRYDGPSRPETRLVRYIPETGHNIPQVFWDYFHQRGPVFVDGRLVNGQIVDWVFAMGYPISEAYWTKVNVNGAPRWTLVQAYERRVLTYTPDNPQEWRVEMGNVGLHYYFWRYGVLPR